MAQAENGNAVVNGNEARGNHLLAALFRLKPLSD